MGEWQPIASAPKDSAPILAWIKGMAWPEAIWWLQYDPEDAEEVGQPGCWVYADELLANAAEIEAGEILGWQVLPDMPTTPTPQAAETVE